MPREHVPKKLLAFFGEDMPRLFDLGRRHARPKPSSKLDIELQPSRFRPTPRFALQLDFARGSTPMSVSRHVPNSVFHSCLARSAFQLQTPPLLQPLPPRPAFCFHEAGR